MHTELDRLDQTQNILIRQHLAQMCGEISFNRYVTVAFTYSKYGTPLRKHDISDVKNLVQVYSRKLSWSVYGRERNQSKPRLKMLAWPEYKLRNGDSGHLHYHILVQFPDEHIDYLTIMTLEYWRSMGDKHFGCRPSIDIREAYNPSGAAAYSSKHIESDFTVQSMVVSGLF